MLSSHRPDLLLLVALGRPRGLRAWVWVPAELQLRYCRDSRGAGAQRVPLFSSPAASSGAGKRLLAGGLRPPRASRLRGVPGSNLEPEELPF